MLSTTLRALSLSQLKSLLEKCGIATSVENVKMQFNVSVAFSKNEKGEVFATVYTQNQDRIWWLENKNKATTFWRESDKFLHTFTDYSDSSERSFYIAILRAIKPVTCLNLIAQN
jgi:hypothetical protein